MQPTVFASFQDGEQAERIVGALLDAGVAPEDISLVVATKNGLGGGAQLSESMAGMAVVHATEGGSPQFGHVAEQTDGSYIYESPIGGGISTSTGDDAVSGVEEMDDSQSASENMTYPQSAQSYGSQERFDAAQGANTGFFNTTRPGPEGLGPSDMEENLPGEGELSSMIVPGIGIVLGDGNLATTIVGAGLATEQGGNPAADMQDYLTDQFVPNDLAWLLAKDFREGGAVLAVATPPGALDSSALEQVLESIGAHNVQLVEAAD